MASDDRKQARELMQEAEGNERAQKGPDTLKKARTRLYDKIGERVSIHTIDLIIYGVSALILIILVIGIITGNR